MRATSIPARKMANEFDGYTVTEESKFIAGTRVLGVAISEDGNIILSACADTYCHVICPGDSNGRRELRYRRRDHLWHIKDVAVSGSILASAGRDGRVCVFRVDRPTVKIFRSGWTFPAEALSCELSSDGKLVAALFASVTKSRKVKVFGLSGGFQPFEWAPPPEMAAYRLMNFTIGGTARYMYVALYIPTMGKNPSHLVIRKMIMGTWVDQGSAEIEVEQHEDQKVGLSTNFNMDRCVVATSSSLIVWIPSSGKVVMNDYSNRVAGNHCAMSSDGKIVVAVTDLNSFGVWNADSGMRLTSIRGHFMAGTACSVSADGKRIATASLDGTLRVWRLAQHLTKRTIETRVESGSSTFVASETPTPGKKAETSPGNGSSGEIAASAGIETSLDDEGTGEFTAITRTETPTANEGTEKPTAIAGTETARDIEDTGESTAITRIETPAANDSTGESTASAGTEAPPDNEGTGESTSITRTETSTANEGTEKSTAIAGTETARDSEDTGESTAITRIETPAANDSTGESTASAGTETSQANKGMEQSATGMIPFWSPFAMSCEEHFNMAREVDGRTENTLTIAETRDTLNTVLTQHGGQEVSREEVEEVFCRVIQKRKLRVALGEFIQIFHAIRQEQEEIASRKRLLHDCRMRFRNDAKPDDYLSIRFAGFLICSLRDELQEQQLLSGPLPDDDAVDKEIGSFDDNCDNKIQEEEFIQAAKNLLFSSWEL